MTIQTIAYNVCSFRGWPKEVGITPEQMIQSFIKTMDKYTPDVITLSQTPSSQPGLIVHNIPGGN